MPTVWVINKSSHDFDKATEYGDLAFLTEGHLKRFDVNNMHRQLMRRLKDSKPNDYLLPCGLGTLNSIACAIFAHKHGRLNLLLFKGDGTYLERNIVM